MFRELLWARLRGAKVEGVLVLAAAFLATALMSVGVLTLVAVQPSYDAEQAALGSPDLFVTVSATEAPSAERLLAAAAGVGRLGTTSAISNGVITSSTGAHSAPVLLTAGTASSTPWIAVQSGISSAGGIGLERGLANYLHAKVGSRVVVNGPSGPTTLRVTTIVGDLSADSYPLSAQGTAYLGRDAASSIGLSRATTVRIPVWIRSGTDLASEANFLTAQLKTAGLSVQMHALVNSVTGISVITNLTSAAVGVFGLAAAASALLFVVANVRLRTLRSEREWGGLLAIGWSVRRLRALFAAEQLLPMALGSAAGIIAGSFGAQALTSQLTTMFGAPAVALDYFPLSALVGMFLLLVTCAAIGTSTRQFGAVSPASLLRRELSLSRRPVRPRRRRRVNIPGLGVVLARERPGRTAVSIAMIALAITIGIFSATALATLSYATSSPKAWGLSYSYDLTVPDGTSVTAIAREAAQTAGVASASPTTTGYIKINDVTTLVQAAPTGQKALTPRMTRGHLPANDGEIAIGSGLADATGLKVGDQADIAHSAGHNYRISGIYLGVGNSGAVAIGPPSASLAMVGTPQRSVLVSGGHAAALRTLSGGPLAVSTAESQIALPFASTLRSTLWALAIALGGLGCAVAAASTFTTGIELVPTMALLTSIGASRRSLQRVVMGYTAAVLIPAMIVGTGVGLLLAAQLLPLATQSIGVGGVVIPVQGSILVVISVAAVSAIGCAWPLWQRARRAPVGMLR